MTEKFSLGPRGAFHDCKRVVGHPCVDTLNAVQSWILREAPKVGGIVGLAGVGTGKSFASLLAILAFPGCKKGVLLAEPSQKQHYINCWNRLRQHFRVPSLAFEDGGKTTSLISAGMPVLHFIPYSRLSRPDATDMLDKRDPDVIIADECFPSRTKVLTATGWECIGDICNSKDEKIVASYDGIRVEWKSVVRRMRKKLPPQLVRVIHEQGSFVCTPSHKIWTDTGYVRAGDLAAGTTLRRVPEGFPPQTEEHEVLLGEVSQHGDGYRVLGSASCGCNLQAVREDVLSDFAKAAKPEWPSNSRVLLEALSKRERTQQTGDQSSAECNLQGVLCRSSEEGYMGGAEQQTVGNARVYAQPNEKSLRLLRERLRDQKEGAGNCTVLLSGVLKQRCAESPRAERDTPSGEHCILVGSKCTPRSSKAPSAQNEKMRYLWERFSISWQEAVLLTNVYGSEHGEVREDQRCSEREERSGVIGENEEKQPNVKPGCSCKGYRSITGSYVLVPRWQREDNHASEDAGRLSRVGDGISSTHGCGKGSFSFTAAELQSRSGRASDANSNRGRWQVTQAEEVEVLGSSKDDGLGCTRVVRVEVLQRGSDGEFERCVGEDQAVYDLEIEGNHNYFADGVLVSNCHRISARNSSRTMRFLRFVSRRAEAGNPVRFLGWSGTLMTKSIRDQAHIALFALGDGSPLPLSENEVEEWAMVMDPSRNPDRSSVTAKALRRAFSALASESAADKLSTQMYDALYSKVQESIREGFRSRLIQTPGVIATAGSEIATAIYLHKRPAPSLPTEVRQALVGVRDDWTRPDGEELVEATDVATCARTVASGYHFYWAYPKGEPRDVIEDWFCKRKAYNRELRVKCLLGEVHLDSPLLCWRAAERFYADPPYEGDLPVWRSEAWPAWAKVKDIVQPEPRAKWISDFLAQDAAEWARTHKGIVWYQHDTFGRKVAELAGIRCHGGGPDAERNILAEDGSQSIVASIKAHGSGRDGLQRLFSEQIVCEIPSSGAIWEQLLGRLVRRGQVADVVESWMYLHVEENRAAMRKAVETAEFIYQTTGNQQMLLCADQSWED